MKDGQDGETLPTGMRNDGQRGIHRCGTARRDRSQRTKDTCQQRCAQKGDSLAHKVGYEGNSAQFYTAIFGKKDARQRIIGKAATDGKTIGNGALQHQEGNGSARPRPQDGGQRQQSHAGVERPKLALHIRVATYAHAHTQQQGTQGRHAHGTTAHSLRQHIGTATQYASRKEGYNNQATLHALAPPLRLTYSHNNMASTQLPKVAKPAIMAASTPKVGSEAIT